MTTNALKFDCNNRRFDEVSHWSEVDGHFVYALVDPIKKQPFYIGKGSRDRPWNHLRYKGSNEDTQSYIVALRMLGLEPGVYYIETGLIAEEAYVDEALFIRFARQRGCHLTNKIPGPSKLQGRKRDPAAVRRGVETKKRLGIRNGPAKGVPEGMKLINKN